MKYNSIYDMPYNITPRSERAWGAFVDKTLEGKPIKAFYAYHDYNLAKQEKLMQQNNIYQDDDFTM